MPVDEDINLNAPEGITQDQIDLMNRQADEIEEIARRTESNVSNFEKAKMAFNTMNVEQLEAVNYVTNTNVNQNDLMDLKKLKEYIVQILEEQKRIDEEVDDLGEKYEVQVKDTDDLKKEISSIKNQFTQNFTNVTGMIRNPIGGGLGALRGMTMAGSTAFLPIAVLFLAHEVGKMVYDTITAEVKEMFGAGGIFDTRKIIRDELKQVGNLDHMMNVHRGDIFFTSDTAEFIRQGVSQNDSNARTRIYGHKQYIQEFDR